MKLLICAVALLTCLTFDTFGQTTESPAVPVDQPASYPGGFDSLVVFVSRNLVKPVNIPQKGKVFVSFVVNADGTLTDHKIVKGLSEECNTSALEVIKKMPKWIPATKDNVAVKQNFTLPIKFE